MNNNADSNGFLVNTSPSQIFFNLYGKNSADNLNAGTYYLLPGSIDGSTLITNVVSIPFVQKTIIFSYRMIYQGSSLSAGNRITLKLYNSTSSSTLGTLIASGIIDNSVPTNSKIYIQD